MRRLFIVGITFSLVWAVKFGIGIEGGIEYDRTLLNYSYNSSIYLNDLYNRQSFYGFYLELEALPGLKFEPRFNYFEREGLVAMGVGANIGYCLPIGRLPITAFADGGGGLYLNHPKCDLMNVYQTGQWRQYLLESTPMTGYNGGGGLALAIAHDLLLKFEGRLLNFMYGERFKAVFLGLTYYLGG